MSHFLIPKSLPHNLLCRGLLSSFEIVGQGNCRKRCTFPPIRRDDLENCCSGGLTVCVRLFRGGSGGLVMIFQPLGPPRKQDSLRADGEIRIGGKGCLAMTALPCWRSTLLAMSRHGHGPHFENWQRDRQGLGIVPSAGKPGGVVQISEPFGAPLGKKSFFPWSTVKDRLCLPKARKMVGSRTLTA